MRSFKPAAARPPSGGRHEPSGRDRAVEQVLAELGPIDVLVNNAGAGGPIGALWEIDPDAWWQTVRINLEGTFSCSHAVLPEMVARGRGRIINVASDAGAYRWPYLSHYAVAKAAVIKLTENLAVETRDHGIAVFAIHPGTVLVGPTKTLLEREVAAGSLEAKVQTWFRRQIERGEDVSPERAAELVVRLASGEADELSGRYISVHDDLGELVAQAETVEREDLQVLKLRRLADG